MSASAPHLLLLETSGRIGHVGLALGGNIVGWRHLEEARRHARDLAPSVAALLAQAGWTPRQLAGIIVSRGPGSYTGLRVGIMSAKTFAFATGCALIAVDTFPVIAGQAPSEVTSLDVVADAQQDKIYIQRFARSGPSAALEPTVPLTIQPISSWLMQPDQPGWLTGPGVRMLGDRRPPGCQVLPEQVWDPQLAGLLQIGLARYLAGERDDLWAVEPLYLRPSAAEEKWTHRQAEASR